MKVSLWAEIRRLHEIEKLSARAIARRLRCARRTVCKALAQSEPPRQTREPRSSILDPYKPRIDALIAKYPELSAVRIFEEISKGSDGYRGRLRALSLARRPVQAEDGDHCAHGHTAYVAAAERTHRAPSNEAGHSFHDRISLRLVRSRAQRCRAHARGARPPGRATAVILASASRPRTPSTWSRPGSRCTRATR